MLPYRLIQIIHSYVPMGMMLWLLSWFIPLFDQTERIILFSAFVVVPLLLFRIFESAIEKPVLFIKIFIFLIPIGALALALSFSLSPGGVAGLLSIPWGVTTFAIAALGIVLLGRSATFGDVSKAIGFLYISVGGIWIGPSICPSTVGISRTNHAADGKSFSLCRVCGTGIIRIFIRLRT